MKKKKKKRFTNLVPALAIIGQISSSAKYGDTPILWLISALETYQAINPEYR